MFPRECALALCVLKMRCICEPRGSSEQASEHTAIDVVDYETQEPTAAAAAAAAPLQRSKRVAAGIKAVGPAAQRRETTCGSLASVKILLIMGAHNTARSSHCYGSESVRRLAGRVLSVCCRLLRRHTAAARAKLTRFTKRPGWLAGRHRLQSQVGRCRRCCSEKHERRTTGR